VPAGVPEDLAEIVASWDSLPEALKADILAKVRLAIGD
jgi:hypothetical protein